MSLGLKKYAEQIDKAWKSVLDDKDEINWALFGYDGQSNDLKVISTGKYGLEELESEFNPGKVLYAFVKVLNPKSNLPCFITINWVGEGSSLNRKSSFPNHSIELQKFLKYSNLNINAREEEEIEPNSILDKIRKSSTTEFNFSIKSDLDEDKQLTKPVSRRILPERDINLKEKANFWSKLDNEQKEIKEQEIKKLKEQKLNERNLISSSNKVNNNPLKNNLINNQKLTTKLESSNDDVINKVNKLNLKTELINEREKFWAQQEAEERRQRDEENRKKNLDRRAIENEIKNSENKTKLIMNSFNNPSNTNSQLKKINAIDEINLEKKKALSSINKNSINNKENNNEINIQTDDDSLNDELIIHDDESLSEDKELNNTYIKQHNNSDLNDDDDNANRTFTKQHLNDLQENDYYKLQTEYCANQQQQQQQQQQQTYLINQRINEEDEIYDDEEYENEYCLDNGLTNYPTYLQKRISTEPLEDIAEEDEDQILEEDQILDEEMSDDLKEYIKNNGKCARALFDYQAADDTEISFDPNDIIINIEKVDLNWWVGEIEKDKTKRKGLFPSNYCQELN